MHRRGRAQDTEDKWFEDDGPPPPPPAASTPAAGDAEDPLDAFMAGITATVAKQSTQPAAKPAPPAPSREPEEPDAIDLYYQYKETHKGYGVAYGTADEDVYAAAKAVDADLGYDSDGRPRRKKEPDALPAVDHAKAKYAPFVKRFYEPPEELRTLSAEALKEHLKELDVTVTGCQPITPVRSWQQLGLEAALLEGLARLGFAAPTPIQCAALPVVLAGRDMIGLARTGSGKTVAYLLPLCVHISMQDPLPKGQGPIGLVVTPTRELAQQVYGEARKFLRLYACRVLPIFGGKDRGDQIKALKGGCDAVVCTPGRMVDMLRQRACRLAHCTFLVLDEADKLFEMGFEAQLRSIVGQVRPDRQTVMFSATFDPKLQALARDTMEEPLTVTVGRTGTANADIQQEVLVLQSHAEKWDRLMDLLPDALERGQVLIFVNQKVGCEQLAAGLCQERLFAATLHGEKAQEERDNALAAFREGTVRLLVATDVAARGLDVPAVQTVINYDAPHDTEAYIHRIGRTGRAGAVGGIAYTLLPREDARQSFACDLVRLIEQAGQPAPAPLLDWALLHPAFSQLRHRPLGGEFQGAKKSRRKAIGGAGIGYSEEASAAAPAKAKPKPKPPTPSQAPKGPSAAPPPRPPTPPALPKADPPSEAPAPAPTNTNAHEGNGGSDVAREFPQPNSEPTELPDSSPETGAALHNGNFEASEAPEEGSPEPPVKRYTIVLPRNPAAKVPLPPPGGLPPPSTAPPPAMPKASAAPTISAEELAQAQAQAAYKAQLQQQEAAYLARTLGPDSIRPTGFDDVTGTGGVLVRRRRRSRSHSRSRSRSKGTKRGRRSRSHDRPAKDRDRDRRGSRGREDHRDHGRGGGRGRPRSRSRSRSRSRGRKARRRSRS